MTHPQLYQRSPVKRNLHQWLSEEHKMELYTLTSIWQAMWRSLLKATFWCPLVLVKSSQWIWKREPVYFDDLVQEIRKSSALAMELRISCTNPSVLSMGIWSSNVLQWLDLKIWHQDTSTNNDRQGNNQHSMIFCCAELINRIANMFMLNYVIESEL